MKISIIEPLELPKKEVLNEFNSIDAEIRYHNTPPRSEEELIKRCSGAQIIVLVNQQLPSQVIEEIDQTELISVSFTGYDHIDIEKAEEEGIAVTNIPEYATASVAELVFGLAISLLRKLRICDKEVRDEVDEKRSNLKGNELRNKNLGIIGTGKIGSKVAEMGKKLGMDIIAYSNTVNPEIEDYTTYLPLREVLEKSDIVSLHVPLTKQTKEMIGERELNHMKPDSVLINTARAHVIEKQAFIDAVRNKSIKFGVDVPHSNLPQDVKESDQVIYAPHIGYYTHEALKKRLKTTVNNIKKFIEDERQNRVV
ncbi:hydroxyacid dehydrogenase [archaeon SCG-AAA382B04]|nr:hydroxyacid dehydrogenase [archaeon SCG-AAA382B04]